MHKKMRKLTEESRARWQRAEMTTTNRVAETISRQSLTIRWLLLSSPYSSASNIPYSTKDYFFSHVLQPVVLAEMFPASPTGWIAKAKARRTQDKEKEEKKSEQELIRSRQEKK